ncbi:DNA topoisomerase III [Pyrodictium occultum]|uniref:DNA topoisomerase n=1 Tax=Pyrodictium occultum TaxID=2309 RepID=A0A0V8RVE5_PYROC|nr:DNA topoisomerase I [Pyrodictium occultum]KSW11930.1 DNA topoisomerase III [Pyrodictium occultum]
MGRGYVLVVAEKPKAARKIAEALADGSGARLCRSGRIPFWMVYWAGRLHVIAPAAGHLYGLTTDEHGFPVFSYYWVPLWRIDRGASHTRQFLDVLGRLATSAAIFVNACDYDIEGSVIGYMVIKNVGDVGRAYRAKFSALTRQDVRRAFRKLDPLDWDMIEAGLARHELDWLWGINVSRALMDAVKLVTGRRVVLSAGRVQSPTLIEAVSRDKEIKLHVPLPRFAVRVTVEVGGRSYTGTLAAYEERRAAEAAAERLRRNRVLRVEHYREWMERLQPPYPFNLGDLQAEAARLFGYSPMFTQKIAEQLYLEGLISYPRTNSQKIPPTVDVASIARSLARLNEYRELIDYLLKATRGLLRPRNGPKDDPAHPAIHPTGELPRGALDKAERRIYDLIVRRFLASMAPAGVVAKASARLAAPGIGSMELAGLRVEEPGWLRIYYFAAPEEKAIPRLKPGGLVPVKRVSLSISYTSPPEPYSKASLVKWMERVGIGTEATRARIVELLFERGYLEARGRRVEATELGYAVAGVLSKYFPQLTSVALTRHFEERLEAIRARRAGRREVVEEAKAVLREMLERFKAEAMRDAGMELAKALGLVRPARRCVICGREAVADGLCSFHLEAVKRLVNMYGEWRRRAGLGCRKFLESIAGLRAAGQWVREAAEYFMKKGACPPGLAEYEA